MIRFIVLIIVILVNKTSYSQKRIVGRYTNLKPYQESYNYFDFNDNGIFQYHSGASLGDDVYGKGHYFIKKDSLILYYDLTELNHKSYHKLKEYHNSKDSIQLKITVKDFDKNKNTNANIFVTNKKVGGIISENDYVLLKLKKEQNNFDLEISNLGFEKHKITLPSLKNYEIDVFLKKSSSISKAIKDEVEKYKILEISNSLLKLKRDNRIIKLVHQKYRE